MISLADSLAIAQSLAAAAAVFVAARGLRTWQQQLHGTVEYEHARRLYRAVLNLREEIASVRNPFISPGESDAAFKAANIEPNYERGCDERGTGLVYQRRWDALRKASVTLSAELLEAEALWGAGVREPEKKMNVCIGELYAAVMWHLRERSKSRSSIRERTPSETAMVQRLNDVLYSTSPEESDAFTVRVHQAVRDFETLVRPHLRSRSR